MSKADFFLQLQERLRGLPYEERQNIIQVYEDLFRQAEQNGKSEREIIESLGFVPVPVSPPSFGGYTPPMPARRGSGFRSILAAIALVLFNLIFVLAPAIGIAATLFSLSIASVLFAFSAIWIILGTGIPESFSFLLVEICSALVLTGSGILLGGGLYVVNRGFIRLMKRYVRLNLKLIKGE